MSNRPSKAAIAPVGLIIALLAAIAVSLWLLLPGGALRAQVSGVIEYAENGTDAVATYTAVDPEGTDIASWDLTGFDNAAFTIVGGVLRFVQTPNYEMPTSVLGENMYVITVEATDSTGNTAMEDVTVEVTNVDEAGTVTLSAQRPQAGTEFTAELSDPDGGVFDATIDDQEWQWALAGSKNGIYRDIDNATSDAYTPVDADSNSYLRATVTYEDGQGEGKSAMMVSEFPSQEVPTDNTAPAFDDDQDPVMDGDQAEAKRSVAENTAAGETIGSPVVATDADGDTLTYTLTGDDASYFDIDWGTGQILTKIELDAENVDPALTDRDTTTDGLQLEVVVRATDPSGIPSAQTAQTANSDTVTVMITVTDVNEAPAIIAGDATVNFLEIIDDIATPFGYTALDPDDGAPDTIWSVGGADESKFNIVADGPIGSNLTFKKTPDYENPTDANMDNVYEVTVQASDGKLTSMLKVMVTVDNSEEDGEVTLDKATPVVSIPVMATLTDPDGVILSTLTWEWSIDGVLITGAISDTYTPKVEDVDGSLTVTASYFDGQSATTERLAIGIVRDVVELDSRNKPPMFGDEDPDTDGVQNTMATRKVDEDTEANAVDDDIADQTDDNVDAPVAAEDTKADGTPETLDYTLSGTDAANFRVRDNGQIEVGSGTKLDYETKDTYMVTVTAEDPLGASSSIDVTIMVTDLDEPPDVSGEETPEYAENGTGPVATYTAVDPEGTDTSWDLTGFDNAAFTIVGGVLRFVQTPNYEMPETVLGEKMYVITVAATDSTGNTATKDVTVEVTNVDEAGTVTLSAQQPQAGTPFTAELSDPDGGRFDAIIDDQEWQWASARSKNGAYRDIDNATSDAYTPVDADSNSYLRAKVTYEDGEGEGKSAMMVSEFLSQVAPTDNTAPAFDDDQDPVMDGDQAVAKRSVAENTAAGETIGSPVVATDADGDTLTYTLTGDDASHFDIDWGTGQILTKADLDRETTPTYTLVVRATDPSGIPSALTAQTANSGTVTVMITVTDVNEAPDILGEVMVEFEEVTGDITDPVASYTAVDPDVIRPNPIWSVGGADESKFNIDADGPINSNLTFKETPDYENPTDANMDNVYEVTVEAFDGKNTGMKTVMVSVINEDEDGEVTLDKTTPVVGIPVVATLTDPDGGISELMWEWSLDVLTIDGAESDTYTPKAEDVNGLLQATATYLDGQSPTTEKTASALLVPAVERDTRNKPPVFDDEDPDTDGVQNAMATRKVDENTPANTDDDDLPDAVDETDDNVSAPVAATDTKYDGSVETLTYTLSGTDAAKFRLRLNGQIEVGSGTELDYETKDTYMVTVTAEDPLGASSSIAVTIMVNDVDETPEIIVGGLAISGMRNIDYPENGADAVATYSASGPDAASVTWSLNGDDAGPFSIDSSGVLTFSSPPDYENPDDTDTNNVYMVTIQADDGTYMDTHDITITVTDVDEDAGSYDTDGNGTIDSTEVLSAVKDYFDNRIDATQVLEVVKLYFLGS